MYVNLYYSVGENEQVTGEHTYNSKQEAMNCRRLDLPGLIWTGVIKMRIKEQ